jgi:predicted Zn-dependent protease
MVPPRQEKVPVSSMRWKELQSLFRKAMDLQRNGRGKEAATIFRELIDAGSRDPKHLSYGGLLIATEEGDVKTGLGWCERAVELAFYDPQMYINLARLHERTGWKTQAAKVLRKGLRIDPGNKRLLTEINRVNPRTSNVVPGLARNHPVNRTLGKLKAELEARDKRLKGKATPSYS